MFSRSSYLRNTVLSCDRLRLPTASTSLHHARLISLNCVHKQKEQTYYDLLGVKTTASQKQIRDAFLRLSKQFHPDVNPDDSRSQEKYVRLKDAYDVLSDSETRRDYDQRRVDARKTQTQSQSYAEDEQSSSFGAQFYRSTYSEWQDNAAAQHERIQQRRESERRQTDEDHRDGNAFDRAVNAHDRFTKKWGSYIARFGPYPVVIILGSIVGGSIPILLYVLFVIGPDERRQDRERRAHVERRRQQQQLENETTHVD